MLGPSSSSPIQSPGNHGSRQAAVCGRRSRAHLCYPAFGAYPDGIAFATLLMNILVPIIDMKTQAPVFGHKKD
jgi:Na+-translocating ferredoxin:NAD+ oxidoreductase RnfD subunit